MRARFGALRALALGLLCGAIGFTVALTTSSVSGDAILLNFAECHGSELV